MLVRVGLLALLLVVALTAFVALTRRPTPGAGASAMPQGAAQAVEPSASALAPPALVERDVTPVPPDTVQVEPPRSGALGVRVIGHDGQPAHGIPVAIFASTQEMPAPMPVEQIDTREPDGTAWFETDLRGKPMPAGLRLTVAIDLPLEPAVEHDLGAWVPGEAWTEGIVELVLPDGAAAWLQPLQVVVVDSSGEPVPGVDVQLVARHRYEPSETNGLGSATTRAPDGVALLSRERMREAQPKLAMLQIAVDYEVLCSGPFVPSPSARVSSQASAEPVRIVLPPTGSVQARLVRPDGTRVESGATVSLGWFARGSDRREGYVNVLVADGVARFERLGLGLDLHLGGALAGGAARATGVEIAGPVRAGETLEIELALGPDHPLLVGRLLDAQGEPAAGLLFHLAADLVDPPPRHPASGPRRLSWSAHAADDAGRISIPWGADTTAIGRLLRFQERPHPKLGAPRDWVPLFGQTPFPGLSPDGTRLDVGDVALEPVPVVVAGRVVDGDGEPVNQAWLSLGYPEGEGRNTQWYNLSVPGVSRVSTRADGTFEVRSAQAVSLLRVSASQHSIGASASLEVLPGTRDALLVLERLEDFTKTRGRVLGSLRVDEDIPLLGIEVSLAGQRGESRTYPLAGQIGFENVLPGTYRLLVRTEDGEFVLEEIEDVVVQAGQLTRDARLQGIDLRGRLRVLRLRLSDLDGSALGRTNAWLLAGQDRAALRTDDEGRLTTLVRVEDQALALRAEGFAPLEVGWSPREQSLVLTPE